MEIKETNWGIANRFKDGSIEVNRHLQAEEPTLYRSIIKHELEHDDSTFSWKDLKHDLIRDEKISQWSMIRFMIRHPKSLTQLLPLTYSKNRGAVLDLNLSLMYIILIIIIGGSIMLALKFF